MMSLRPLQPYSQQVMPPGEATLPAAAFSRESLAPSDTAPDEQDAFGCSPASTMSIFGAAMELYGSSPVTPLFPFGHATHFKPTSISAAVPPYIAAQSPARPADFLHLSLPTLLGCSEMLGHMMEDRSDIARQQNADMVAQLQSCSTAPLRDESQRPLFVVAPLDVLVTRDTAGRNQFHIIEINGTGISGLTNMSDDAVQDVLQSFSELPSCLLTQPECVVLVASSGQETFPPVSRMLHEKILYVEALKRGFEAAGRSVSITNMSRLEKRPSSMPAKGVTIVLGYMKQFRANFMLDSAGKLQLFGRQVHAAINDRFVLNIMHQFRHAVDLRSFTGVNAAYAAGADKGVAYQLYNSFFGSDELGAHFECMAPGISFSRAHTRDELVSTVQSWLAHSTRPAVIKPQGTGCGHGIEFFFRSTDTAETVAAKVDRALHTVASTYNLQGGGLPYTVCEYLDTATVNALRTTTADAELEAAAAGELPSKDKHGHKFELRVVVYRAGGELRAYPSIAKVAREAYDPRNPDNKKSLINNITTSAKETAQSGQEFLLPLSCSSTLRLLGITAAELAELCAACTHFVRYVVDQVQDNPELFDLPPA